MHRTGSAHLRVFDDMLLTIDSGFDVRLVLLDLSADVYASVDHEI